MIEELGIDLALVGHDHAYARTHAMKEGQPVDPGEGTVYVIGGSSGPKFYPKNNMTILTLFTVKTNKYTQPFM